MLYGQVDAWVQKISLSYDINKWYHDNDINKFIIDYKKETKYYIYYKDINKIEKILSDRNKFLGGSYFYNIGKLLNGGKSSLLWRDCKVIN